MFMASFVSFYSFVGRPIDRNFSVNPVQSDSPTKGMGEEAVAAQTAVILTAGQDTTVANLLPAFSCSIS
jgi:hypothetical protein